MSRHTARDTPPTRPAAGRVRVASVMPGHVVRSVAARRASFSALSLPGSGWWTTSVWPAVPAEPVGNPLGPGGATA